MLRCPDIEGLDKHLYRPAAALCDAIEQTDSRFFPCGSHCFLEGSVCVQTCLFSTTINPNTGICTTKECTAREPNLDTSAGTGTTLPCGPKCFLDPQSGGTCQLECADRSHYRKDEETGRCVPKDCDQRTPVSGSCAVDGDAGLCTLRFLFYFIALFLFYFFCFILFFGFGFVVLLYFILPVDCLFFV
jgi:hypothetical protein